MVNDAVDKLLQIRGFVRGHRLALPPNRYHRAYDQCVNLMCEVSSIQSPQMLNLQATAYGIDEERKAYLELWYDDLQRLGESE